jgi:hypothetical protein
MTLKNFFSGDVVEQTDGTFFASSHSSQHQYFFILQSHVNSFFCALGSVGPGNRQGIMESALHSFNEYGKIFYRSLNVYSISS